MVALASRCFADFHQESTRVLTMPSSIWASPATLPKLEDVKIQVAICLVRCRILVANFALLTSPQYMSKISVILFLILQCVNHLTPATLRFVV